MRVSIIAGQANLIPLSDQILRSTTMGTMNRLINSSFDLQDTEKIRKYYSIFQEDDFVHFKSFLSDLGMSLLKKEVLNIYRFLKRRDLVMEETGGTLRKLSTVGSKVIQENSRLVPDFYCFNELQLFLSEIAGRSIYTVEDENYVLNVLHKKGDEHGAHVDTYAYAFNLILQMPPSNCGGELEFASKNRNHDSFQDPKKVKRPNLSAGDAYLLKTDAAIHRVSALKVDSNRTVLNFAYADSFTLNKKSYSSHILYD